MFDWSKRNFLWKTLDSANNADNADNADNAWSSLAWRFSQDSNQAGYIIAARTALD